MNSIKILKECKQIHQKIFQYKLFYDRNPVFFEALNIATKLNYVEIMDLLLNEYEMVRPSGKSMSKFDDFFKAVTKLEKWNYVETLIKAGYKTSKLAFKSIASTIPYNYFLDLIDFKSDERFIDESIMKTAIEAHRLDIFKYYLDKGISIESKLEPTGKPDDKCNNIISAVFAYGTSEMVDELIKRGINLNTPGLPSPLSASIQSNNIPMANYLIRNSVECDDEDIERCFLLSAAGGHIHMVKYFISQGASIRSFNEKGETALMLAAMMNHPKILEFLMTFKHDLDRGDFIGESALYKACVSKSYECIKILLENGASPLRVAKNKYNGK